MEKQYVKKYSKNLYNVYVCKKKIVLEYSRSTKYLISNNESIVKQVDFYFVICKNHFTLCYVLCYNKHKYCSSIADSNSLLLNYI